MFLGIDAVVDAHPFVQVPDRDLIKSGWQKSMFGFEVFERRADGNGSGSFVVADQIQMIGHSFSFGFNLIPLLFRQLEKAVRNSQVANPDSLRSSNVIL